MLRNEKAAVIETAAFYFFAHQSNPLVSRPIPPHTAFGENLWLKAGSKAGVVVSVHVRFHQIPISAAKFRVSVAETNTRPGIAMVVDGVRPVIAVVCELLVIGVGDDHVLGRVPAILRRFPAVGIRRIIGLG